MVKLKKILMLVLTVMLINIPYSLICAAQNEEYIGNIVYKTNLNNVTASVDVTSENKKRILILAAYKNGRLKRIAGDSKVINGTITLTASIDKSDTDEIIATVIDAFGGDVLTKKAVYGTDSTSLEYIKVNGKEIAYDDGTDEYRVQYSKEPVVLDVAVKDSTTKANVSDYSLPGNANIEIVSASGNRRNIVLHLYKTQDELYKLNSIKYMIGEKVYEVDGFNPNTKQYSIELEDNVMGVTLLPEAMSDVSVMIANSCVTTLGGVSLGSMYSTGVDAYQYRHNARNNYIPIKNEKTTAYVTVTSEDKSTQYQFDFVSKQPRLTSFEYVGAAEDTYKPVFIGGSAVNNDYGTILSTDRMWAIGNISKALLGGSCFMLPASNKNGNWWNQNTSGEYFNFSADTAGTVYVLSGNVIANAQYADWTTGNGTAELPDDKSWVTVAKDWNDYSAKYFASVIEHQDNYSRAVNPGIAENTGNDTMLYPVEMKYYAYKPFKDGEKVSIYHTGRTGQNAAKSIVIIVWNLSSENEEEITPDEPPISDETEDKDKIMSLVFNEETETTGNIWKDNSGYSNDITLYVDDNNKWTTGGFMVTGGSAGSVQMPTAVNDAINSNVFTLQFELTELNSEAGKKCGVLSSANGDFEIYKSNQNDNVFFKWAGNTTSLRMPKVTAEQMKGHLNTIVVDKNESDETQKIKWYIDGELVAKAKMNVTDKTVDKIVLSNPDNTYGGNVVFGRLIVYKKALDVEEITGGSKE